MSSTLSPQTLRAVARVTIGAGRPIRLAMRGGSMLPLLHEPMILQVAPLTGRPGVGDVIVFAGGDIQVVHRVIGYAGEHYVTSGDAQPLVTEVVDPADVLGRVEAVWENASPLARRVDVGFYQLRGFWYARAHRIRGLAVRSKTRARTLLRRLRRNIPLEKR